MKSRELLPSEVTPNTNLLRETTAPQVACSEFIAHNGCGAWMRLRRARRCLS